MNAALKFLEIHTPAGPWGLMAIDPEKSDKPAYKTCTSREDALGFIDRYNGRRNLYYLVNRPKGSPHKKPDKASIVACPYLHVDIDARAGEDLAEEIGRIRAVAHGKPPPGVPAPTLMVMSGGGYNLLWRLAEPTDVATAERVNLALANAYGGDCCHNADRVLRLPGTTNIPDAKKRARGRTEALAEMTGSYPDRVYPLAKFPAHQEPAEVIQSTPPPEPCDAEYPDDLGALLVAHKVPTRVSDLILETPPKGMRSEGVFDLVCNLLRFNVPRPIVKGILLNPDWDVSSHVREQPNPAKYAQRQIDRATDRIAEDPKEEFTVNEKGVPYASQRNIRVAVRLLGARLSHDKFADRLLVGDRVLQDEDVNRLYLQTDERYGFRPAKDFFCMVVEDEARRSSYHPVLDYLDGLEWDGRGRIDTWLAEYGGAEDNEFNRAVGALVLLAAVRRVRQPGVKFDEMLVLHSAQGSGKSTAIAALSPVAEWFSDDLPLGADTKVVIERLHGRWIVEAAELKGMRRANVEQLKSFLSRQVDRARMAYGRLVKEAPRQCVIIGTTNSEKFLRDTTGDRRYWPVKVAGFDVARLRADRDQLWAEAVQREAAGCSIRLDPALWGTAADVQRAHRVDEPFTVELERVLGDMEGRLLAYDAWEILGILPGHRTQDHNERFGAAMRDLGWTRKQLRFGRPCPEWCYVRGDKHAGRIMIRRGTDGRVWAEHENAREPF